MRRKSPQQLPVETSGSESRLKLILLVIAFFLVVGYAATLTNLTGALMPVIDAAMEARRSLLLIAGLMAAAACLGLVVLRLSRRRGGLAVVTEAATDALAGLAGRGEFTELLAAQLEAHAKAGRQLALHLVDIDRFGAVNDILGEAEGDAFLRSVAERLLVLVENPMRLARIGDDEFAVLQPEAGGARHAEIYARRIQETLKDACAQVPRHARPGASVGVAVAPEHGADSACLFHKASLALHAAKQAGGETFRLYAREMEMKAEARLRMEKAISDGLHQGWFELYFQPQYDLRFRRLTGFEALIRMNHLQLGKLLPGIFLPAAEDSGLIQPLGEWIIREALSIAAEWPPHLTLSVNVSAAQLRHGDAAATILQGLSKSGFEGARLQVEIPEAVLLYQSDSVHDQLRRLKGRGITIVVDDFGLDNSSLQSLARSSCDAVKLDRTLVQRVGEEPEAENLVRSLIGTARSFDLAILAEGIERAEQAHFLMSHGCRNVQGFLFGRPVPATELAAIIAKDLRKTMSGEQPEFSASSAVV